MSQSSFFKCPCQHCSGPIEFPPHGVGLMIDCPHCGKKTVLTAAAASAPAAVPVPKPKPDPAPASDGFTLPASTSRAPLLITVAVLILAGAGGAWWFYKKSRTPTPVPTKATIAGKLAALAAAENTNAPAEPPPEPPSAPKSPDDLKAGPVSLEKAKSGSLVYAVGTVKNDSSHQRFGVKVQIEFTDTKGRPAGKATDYTQIIEPRKEWRFRALVLDARANAGKVVAIQEDH